MQPAPASMKILIVAAERQLEVVPWAKEALPPVL
jgi:hypothetical protein